MLRPTARFVPFVLSLLLLVAPLASAADFVTRGTFIMNAVSAFDISPLHTGTLPYVRVPAIQKPYVQAAYNKGALKVFGEDLMPGRSLTRGQAAVVLQALSGLSPKAKGASYTDVKDKALADAVALAVEQGWMKPLRRAMFGADRELDTSEASLIAKRIERSLGTIPAVPSRLRPTRPTTQVETQQTKILNSVWELLQKDFLYKDRLDAGKANRDAAEAMVKSLKDPYTVYMPPAENKLFQDQIHGELTGIGVQVEYREEGLLVVAPLPNSPAEKAGIRAGDVITAVNGETLKGLSYQEAVNKVRGPKGSTAKISVLRDGTSLEYSVQRDTVKVPELTLTMQGRVAVVKVNQFGETTEREIRSIFKKAQEESPVGLILDLRNNPGGLLHAADVLMGAFVAEKTVIANIHTRDGIYAETSDGEPIFDSGLPVYVLVNKGSASASEIVAGAFQDTGRGTVVGETTFGKGTVQQIVEFRDGSSLKMTIAEWKTPKDRKIDGVGVKPDIAVDSTTEADASLKRALELLR